jgi:PII-like signaling protein
MKSESDACLLRIFIGESDKCKLKSLYEEIIEEARKAGMAGGTVIRGCLGYGANSIVHTSKVLRLSEDLPIIIEIVDNEEKIKSFLPKVDELVKEGLVTIEKAHVIFYRGNSLVKK